MKTPDQIAAEMLAGLEGVAEGPWHASCLYVGEDENNPVGIHVEDDAEQHIAFFESEGTGSVALAEHVARCDPQSIRALLEDRAMWKERAEKAEWVGRIMTSESKERQLSALTNKRTAIAQRLSILRSGMYDAEQELPGLEKQFDAVEEQISEMERAP